MGIGSSANDACWRWGYESLAQTLCHNKIRHVVERESAFKPILSDLAHGEQRACVVEATEIAGLKLDADWVILSACNTAAGGAEEAEALSGLARVFFYAGARSLLVSHWSVESNATVKLITKALGIMATDKSIGRSEALRRSMLALIDKGEPQEAHPAYWAPFVVVGEGSSEPSALITPSIVSDPQGQSPTKVVHRHSKKAVPSDWRKEVWRQ